MKTTMNVRTKTNLMIGSLLLAGLLSGACSREEAPQLPPAATPGVPPVVSVRLADYHQSGSLLAGENEADRSGRLPLRGRCADPHLRGPRPRGRQLEPRTGQLRGDALSGGQRRWADRPFRSPGAEDDRGRMAAAHRVGCRRAAAALLLGPGEPRGGRRNPGQLSATLTRGVARFDLRIRAAGVAEVRSITLTNAARSAYLFPCPKASRLPTCRSGMRRCVSTRR